MIDNYIMDQSPRITMTLSEILANTPPVQTLAQATDVPGTNLEWMKTAAYPTGAWYGDLGELGTTGFRDGLFTGYLARGVTCKVSGVPYSWSGAAWVGAGNVLPTYETWGEAIIAAGTTKGWVGLVRRLCGNGYFHAMHNGSRLGVQCGESIIRDAGPAGAGYDLTATGTAYVALASYTIPAGLIGDGEEWEGDCFAASLSVAAGGTSYPKVRIAAAAISSQYGLASANRVCRNRGASVRLGAKLLTRDGVQPDLYADTYNADVAVTWTDPVAVDAGFSPGAATSTLRLRYWALRRIG